MFKKVVKSYTCYTNTTCTSTSVDSLEECISSELSGSDTLDQDSGIYRNYWVVRYDGNGEPFEICEEISVQTPLNKPLPPLTSYTEGQDFYQKVNMKNDLLLFVYIPQYSFNPDDCNPDPDDLE